MIALKTLNRPRVILFTILALLSIYVLVVQELLYLLGDQADFTRYKSLSWVLIPHAVFGLIALVIGPFQFSTTLRKNNLQLHKKIG